jgi:nucleoside-diphosphate-sugar epimerase
MSEPVCAITGSSGYVGSCIKNYFDLQGWKTLEITRRPKSPANGIAFQLGETISPALLSGINTLVHCAYDLKLLRWKEIHSINVLGTKKLFQAARAAGVQKIVCISSISAYDGCHSLYGKAKLEIEKIALAHNALVIRPGLVYGSNPGGMFGKLTAQVRKSSVIPLIGGSQKQFLVDQEDLSTFIARYAANEIEIQPGILTAAHPHPLSFRQLLLEIAGRLGKKIKFIPVPWQLVWAGLKTAELCGLKINFRSDSLVGMIYQNPQPDFSANASIGLVCRPFEISETHL